MVISARLQYALMKAAANRCLSKSLIVEEALWREIGRLTVQDKGRVVQRLKYLGALISEIVAVGMVVVPVGELNVPGRTPGDMHSKESRRERRNELSQKVHTAMSQVFDLAQSEALAEENRMRAEMFRVLAQLASIDALILKDAAEEEVLEGIEKLREEEREYEEATRRLEAEAKQLAAKK
jgi:hypothetical protein